MPFVAMLCPPVYNSPIIYILDIRLDIILDNLVLKKQVVHNAHQPEIPSLLKQIKLTVTSHGSDTGIYRLWDEKTLDIQNS
jgi:hypothetical protein